MKIILTYIIVLLLIFNTSAQNVQLDPTFGNGGILLTSVIDFDFPKDIATQSTGKILVVQNAEQGAKIIRFNNNGTIDLDFGISGVVNVDFIDLIKFGGLNINKILVEADDKILIAGDINNYENDLGQDFAIARLTPDGILDETFGIGGKVVQNLTNEDDDLGMDIIISKSGGYLLSGIQIVQNQNNNLSLLKLDENGKVDKSFGTDGYIITPIIQSDIATNMLVEQSDGKIIVGGSMFDLNLYFPFVGLVRYDLNGQIDESFGLKGIAQTNYTDPIILSLIPKILIQSDDNIVSPGLIARAGIDTTLTPGAIGFNKLGKLNNSFGNAGVARLENEKVDTIFESDKLFIPSVLQPDDKIVIAYKKSNYVNLYRLNKDGSLDTDFGNNGLFTFDFEFPLQKSDLGSLYWSKSDNKLLYCISTDGNQFADIGIARIDVDYKTSTKEESQNIESLNVYPNPANNLISLTTNILKTGFASYSIKSVEGKTLLGKDLGKLPKGAQQLNINVADLVPGLYILSLNLDNESQNIKLIKE